MCFPKNRNEKTEGILIVPVSISQSWFTKLLTFLIKEHLWLPSSDVSLTFPYRRKSIPYFPKTRRCLSGDDCKSRIFRAKFQTLFSNHGNLGQVGNMMSIYPKLLQFCSERNFSLCETTINQICYFCMTYFRVELGIV